MRPRFKKQSQFYTLLIVVEGETEEAFCQYLKSVLQKKSKIRIANARGGSPACIVKFAEKYPHRREFKHIAILLDADKFMQENVRKKVENMKAHLFQFSPCVEGFFLRLMKKVVPAESTACKNRFHKIGLNERAKLNFPEYAKIFPVDKFEELSKDQQFRKPKGLIANDSGHSSIDSTLVR